MAKKKKARATTRKISYAPIQKAAAGVAITALIIMLIADSWPK